MAHTRAKVPQQHDRTNIFSDLNHNVLRPSCLAPTFEPEGSVAFDLYSAGFNIPLPPPLPGGGRLPGTTLKDVVSAMRSQPGMSATKLVCWAKAFHDLSANLPERSLRAGVLTAIPGFDHQAAAGSPTKRQSAIIAAHIRTAIMNFCKQEPAFSMALEAWGMTSPGSYAAAFSGIMNAVFLNAAADDSWDVITAATVLSKCDQPVMAGIMVEGGILNALATALTHDVGILNSAEAAHETQCILDAFVLLARQHAIWGANVAPDSAAAPLAHEKLLAWMWDKARAERCRSRQLHIFSCQLDALRCLALILSSPNVCRQAMTNAPTLIRDVAQHAEAAWSTAPDFLARVMELLDSARAGCLLHGGAQLADDLDSATQRVRELQRGLAAPAQVETDVGSAVAAVAAPCAGVPGLSAHGAGAGGAEAPSSTAPGAASSSRKRRPEALHSGMVSYG